jgi:hypothetical protein
MTIIWLLHKPKLLQLRKFLIIYEHKHFAHGPLLSLNELIIIKLNDWEMNKTLLL